MNNELKEKYKKLYQDCRELYHMLVLLDDYLRDKGYYYKKESSLVALKKIKEYRKKKWEEYDKLKHEMEITKISFQKSCEHPIIVKAKNGEACACCGRPIFDKEGTRLYEIEIPFDSHLVGYDALMDDGDTYTIDYIHEIADKYVDSPDELEDKLEYLQDNSKAIVRKLK